MGNPGRVRLREFRLVCKRSVFSEQQRDGGSPTSTLMVGWISLFGRSIVTAIHHTPHCPKTGRNSMAVGRYQLSHARRKSIIASCIDTANVSDARCEPHRRSSTLSHFHWSRPRSSHPVPGRVPHSESQVAGDSRMQWLVHGQY